MRKASDFLSKPLISLNEGKNEGVIKNISFDAKLQAAEWLVLYDENDCDCDEKAVPVSEAYSVGENAVMIKSGQAVVPAVSAPLRDNNPINCRIFTALGKLVGVVSDVILTDGNRTSELVYDKDKILPLSDIVSSSRDIVVKSEGGIKAKAQVQEKKVPAPGPEDTKRKVRALSKEKVKPASASGEPRGKEAATVNGLQELPEKKAETEISRPEKPRPGKEPEAGKANSEKRPQRGKAGTGKKNAAAPGKKVKKNESAGVTAESVEAAPVPVKISPAASGGGAAPAETAPILSGTASALVETAAPVKNAAENGGGETPSPSVTGGAVAKTLSAEDIVIKVSPEHPAPPAPRAENPYKIYDDISANFSDLYQPEIFVYGTGNAAEPSDAKSLEENGGGLGIAVPIKKKPQPDDRRKEQLVKAFQLRHEPVTEAAAEPVTPLIFNNGGSIEIWPLELEHIPERIITSYNFLLGRRVAKNIYNAAHQLVIKADTLVNPQIVETARKYGRLVDLTKLSL